MHTLTYGILNVKLMKNFTWNNLASLIKQVGQGEPARLGDPGRRVIVLAHQAGAANQLS